MRSLPSFWPIVVFYKVSPNATTVVIARVLDGRMDLGTLFRVPPAARMHIIAHLTAQAKIEKAPQFHEDYITVDLARESFADAFTNTTMIMLRVAGQSRRRGEIQALLGQHEDKVPFLEQQLERWLSSA
jgi:hypothetical protein